MRLFHLSTLTTSDTLAPNLNIQKMFPQPFRNQTKERQPSPASPTEFQTSETLHSKTHEQTHNEAKDDPPIPQNTYTQCRLARKKPLLTSLSNMRIWPHAAVHRKKDTPLGGLNMLNALLRERNSEGATNRIIIGADIKSTTP